MHHGYVSASHFSFARVRSSTSARRQHSSPRGTRARRRRRRATSLESLPPRPSQWSQKRSPRTCGTSSHCVARPSEPLVPRKEHKYAHTVRKAAPSVLSMRSNLRCSSHKVTNVLPLRVHHELPRFRSANCRYSFGDSAHCFARYTRLEDFSL